MNRKLAAERVVRRHKVASLKSQVGSALEKHKREASLIKSAIREVGLSNVVKQAKNRNVIKSRDAILKGISSKPLKMQFSTVLEVFQKRDELAVELVGNSQSKKAGFLSSIFPAWLLKALAWLTATKVGIVALIIGCICVILLGMILGWLILESSAYYFEAFLRFVFIKFPFLIFKAVLSPLKFMYDLASKFDAKLVKDKKDFDFESIESASDREEVEQFRRSR